MADADFAFARSGYSLLAAAIAHICNRHRSISAGIGRFSACEANFFTGELALQQGKKDEAKRLLRNLI